MERIKIHTPEKMWIIADGPKSDVGAEAKDLCIEARREAEHGVRWYIPTLTSDFARGSKQV